MRQQFRKQGYYAARFAVVFRLRTGNNQPVLVPQDVLSSKANHLRRSPGSSVSSECNNQPPLRIRCSCNAPLRLNPRDVVLPLRIPSVGAVHSLKRIPAHDFTSTTARGSFFQKPGVVNSRGRPAQHFEDPLWVFLQYQRCKGDRRPD